MPLTETACPTRSLCRPHSAPRYRIRVAHRIAQRHRRLLRQECRSAACATKTKLCPPCRVTASTGTTAIGVVLQMTRALIICALRSVSGDVCTGAFTRIPCSVLIHLRRQKIDLRLFQQLAAVVRQIHVQPLSTWPAARSERRCTPRDPCSHPPWSAVVRRRNIVAHVHRNVAHDAVKRRANRVVGQLLFLRLARLHRRLVIRLGVFEGLLRLVVDCRGSSRPPQTACAAAPPPPCCSRRAPSSAAPWPAATPPSPPAAAGRSPSAPGPAFT